MVAITASIFLSIPSNGQKPKEIVTLQFISFPKNSKPEPVELLLGDGKTMIVKIPTNDLSKSYEVPKLSTWAVGKTETVKVEVDGKEIEKPAFTTYGKAPSIASKTQLILLIRNGKNNADGMKVIPIDNEMENFGGGNFFFYNASTVDIGGLVAKHDFALKPGEFSIVKPVKGVDERKGMKFAFTKLFYRHKKVTKPFFSSTWQVNKKARSMVFFYHDPHNGRLRFHSIRSFMP